MKINHIVLKIPFNITVFSKKHGFSIANVSYAIKRWCGKTGIPSGNTKKILDILENTIGYELYTRPDFKFKESGKKSLSSLNHYVVVKESNLTVLDSFHINQLDNALELAGQKNGIVITKPALLEKLHAKQVLNEYFN